MDLRKLNDQEEQAMRLVNRAAITLRVKQSYIDWANGLDQDGPEITPEHLPESRVYLVEDISEYLIEPQDVIKRYYRQLFAHQLRAWHRVESDWPRRRTLATSAMVRGPKSTLMASDFHQRRLQRSRIWHSQAPLDGEMLQKPHHAFQYYLSPS